MTEPQKEYIITGERLETMIAFMRMFGDKNEIDIAENEVRSRPYSSAKESSEKVLDELEQLIDARVYNDMTGIVIKRSVLDKFIKGHRQQEMKK